MVLEQEVMLEADQDASKTRSESVLRCSDVLGVQEM